MLDVEMNGMQSNVSRPYPKRSFRIGEFRIQSSEFSNINSQPA